MNKITELLLQQQEYDRKIKEAEETRPDKLEIEIKGRDNMPAAVLAFDPVLGLVSIREAGGSKISLCPSVLPALYKAIGELLSEQEEQGE